MQAASEPPTPQTGRGRAAGAPAAPGLSESPALSNPVVRDLRRPPLRQARHNTSGLRPGSPPWAPPACEGRKWSQAGPQGGDPGCLAPRRLFPPPIPCARGGHTAGLPGRGLVRSRSRPRIGPPDGGSVCRKIGAPLPSSRPRIGPPEFPAEASSPLGLVPPLQSSRPQIGPPGLPAADWSSRRGGAGPP